MIIKNRRFKVQFLSLIFFSLSINAQQLYDVSRYADDSGLPSRIVRDVMQDREGFIWVAGNNGLYKFDGKSFHPYYASLKDSTGLRDNKITAITQTKDDIIWVGTPKGLHALSGNNISYFELKQNPSEEENYIKSFVEDTDNNLWVATSGGLFFVNTTNEQSLFMSHPDIGIVPRKTISGLSKHKNNSIWVTSGEKVYTNNTRNTFEFKEIEVNFSDDLNSTEIILFNIIDYNGQFMLVESNQGLLKATLINNSVLNLSRFFNENNDPTAKEYIYRALIDHNNDIWTATWKNRFKKYTVSNESLIEQEVISNSGSMLNMSGNAMSMYEDAQNNIWIPNTNGLYKLTASRNTIRVFPPTYIPDCLPDGLSVYSIAEDKGGHIWITTPVDLYRFNKEDILNGKCPENYIHIKNDNLQLSRNLYIDSKNRLWIGAEGSLSVTQLDANYNPGKIIHYTKRDGLPHNWSFDILEENTNTFWVGNYGGLVKLTLPNGQIDNVEFKIYESKTTDPNSLVNSYATDLEKDKNGHLWIGTFHGLSKLFSENDQGHFINYVNKHGVYNSLSNNSIKQVFKDDQDNLWIGTQTGLNLYDYKTDTFLQIGREEGLPSEYILGLAQDSKGFLWIATTNGVIKTLFDKSSRTLTNITHYTKNEGLVDNITYRNALFIDKDNNSIIGSRNGLSIISNEKPEKQIVKFNLSITSFKHTKKNTTDFSIQEDDTRSNNFNLKHFENSIKIDYAVLDFTNLENNRYRHKIVPIHTQWVETGNVAQLTYYNLAPGTYEIILDGSNNPNNWSDEPIYIDLTITPPFFRSNTAYLIYLLLIAGILRYFYLLRIRKRIKELEHKSRLESALINEREQLRKENTADFHDELGSKVTKISLFLTLAERSVTDKKDPTEWHLKIRENIKDLSGGFRDLLWVIDPKKDSLSDALERLKDYGEDIFNNGKIQFRFRAHKADQATVRLDPKTKKQIVMIFKEAMNNCAKYSECSNVDLKITSEQNYSSLELTDDGKGFDIEIQPKGRGLKNMKNRAKKIDATLIINSTPNGTSVLLQRIPHMSNNY